MNDTTRVVHETIAKIAKMEVSNLQPTSRLAEDLKMKSVSRIELAALLEDLLRVQIDNFEIRRPKTVEDVVALVQRKL